MIKTIPELPESEARNLMSEFEREGLALLEGSGVERDFNAVIFFGMAKAVSDLRKRVKELESLTGL